MKLSKYDGHWVRITDVSGEVFEGACTHCSAEFCEAEIGPTEEALNIDNWMFFHSDIRSVRRIQPRDVFVWKSRTAYSVRIDADTFETLDWEDHTVSVPVRGLLPPAVRAGDVIRFESKADETDVMIELVEGVRRDPETGEVATVEVRVP